MNARIVESTINILSVATSSSSVTSAIDLNKANKFSIQVLSTVGASVATLQGSNDQTNWTTVDSFSLSAAATNIFNQPDCGYRWARISLANNDAVPISAKCFVLVIGDSE